MVTVAPLQGAPISYAFVMASISSSNLFPEEPSMFWIEFPLFDDWTKTVPVHAAPLVWQVPYLACLVGWVAEISVCCKYFPARQLIHFPGPLPMHS